MSRTGTTKTGHRRRAHHGRHERRTNRRGQKDLDHREGDRMESLQGDSRNSFLWAQSKARLYAIWLLQL